MKKIMMSVLLMPMMALATTWYVNGSSGSDYNSGTSQSSAKSTIQAAIDASSDGDTILVSPGTYAPITTENKAITIRSTAGAESTIIDGGGVAPCTVLCESMDNKATHSTILVGFTLRNGYVSGEWRGGAGTGGTFKNCIISDNVGYGYGAAGGCVASVVQNSLVCRNRYSDSGGWGGGALANCTDVFNCTIVNNVGYGVWDGDQANCIIYGNTSDVYVSYGNDGHNNYCLTGSLISSGVGNMSGDPAFVDAANGDYRLAAGSPCIDAGDNSYVTTTTDLAGNARIVNGRVDIGCYEYGSSPAGGSLTDGLVAYYPFDGNANDASGNGNNGVVNGATLTADRFGNANGAYYFDGNDDVITVPHNTTIADISRNITISCWFAPDGWNRYLPIVNKNSQISVFFERGGYAYDVDTFLGPMLTEDDFAVGIDLPMSGWHHLVMTSDADCIKLFIDGVMTARHEGGINVAGSTSSMWFGSWYSHGYYYKGKLDDMRLYNRALTAAEVKALYDGTLVTPVPPANGLWTVTQYNLTEDIVHDRVDHIVEYTEAGIANMSIRNGDPVTKSYQTLAFMQDLPSYRDAHFRDAMTNYPGPWSNYFVVEAIGTINIPEAGYWTFACGADDVFSATISGNGVSQEFHSSRSGAVSTDLKTVYFATAGRCNVRVLQINGYSEAALEFSVAKGSYSSFDSSAFKLVGDPASGVTLVGGGEYHTVTFDMNGADGGAPAQRQIAHGAAVGALPTVTREGYEFLGWHRGKEASSEEVTASTIVTGNLIVYAVWRSAYNVPFDANGGTGGSTYTYYHGDNLGSLPTPYRTGYTFTGWFTAKTGGSQVGYYTTVYGNAIYYAQWRVNSYTVTFNGNSADGATPAGRSVTHGAAVGALPTPSRTGYAFLGWFTAANGGSQISASTVVTGNVTYYAHWQAKTYTVTFNANGGNSSCSYSRTYGSQVGTLPTASRSGYVFKGWFTAASGGLQVSASTAVTGNATYYAHWATHAEEIAATLGTANVEFSTDSNAAWFPDGSAVRSGYISHNGSSTMSVKLYGSGLLSFRWKVSSEPEYDALTYSIDGIQGGRISGEQSWTSASILVAGAGWHTVRFTYGKDGGSTYGSDCGWVDSLTWTGSAPPVTNCKITFNLNGAVGAAPAGRSVVKGAQLGTLPVPTWSGYTFLGWYTAASGGAQVYASTKVTSNATYYAHWQKNSSGGGSGGGATPPAATYTVTFDGNGGSVDTPRVTRTAGSTIGSMPTPEAEGYEFLGWFTAKTGGAQVAATTKVTRNVTYYAHWQAAADENTLWDEDEAFDADAAAVFDGFLTKDGEVKGVIQVKVGKAKKNTGVAKISAKVTLLGSSGKLSYKGAFGKPGATDDDFAPGTATLKCAGQPDLELRLGRHALWGEMGRYDIEGARNVFAKSGDPKASVLTKWQGTYTLALETVDATGTGLAFTRGYSGLTVTVGAKGKVKVKGTMVDGAKVSVSSQLLAGDERCCIPVVVPLYSKRGGFGFNLWLQDDGSIEVGEMSSWDATASSTPFTAWFGEDVPIARTGAAFPESMSFMLADDPDIGGEEVLFDFLPWEVVFRSAGWAMPAAGSIKYSAEEDEYVDVKNSDNPAGLKLKYVAKMGSFKGSFNMYGVSSSGKLGKHKANVSGVMVGRKGYGTATVKGVGSWAVIVE